nr:pirin family protein [Kineococcus aurantiacus]
MTVRRTLPQRGLTLVGSWCFLDHFGPDRVEASGGMRVPRHPHTGLATVTWLFTGSVAHLDSAGYRAVVAPGQVNLMVAGRGISHQEFSTPGTGVLHGTQLWFALPDATRHREPTFEHHEPAPFRRGDAELRVFIGSLAGVTSPVRTYTAPLLGAEVLLPPRGVVDLDLDARSEHAVLLDSGAVAVDGEDLPAAHLAHLPTGRTALTLRAGDDPTRLLLIGGVPLGERIVMWWNFIGRDHDEVVAYRERWQAEIAGTAEGPLRFGEFPPGEPDPLPAPVLPGVRLQPRG